MNFDRNTVIGFILLAVLFFAFFYYTNKQQAALQKQKAYEDSVAHVKDSINKFNAAKQNPVTKNDSANFNAVDSNGTDIRCGLSWRKNVSTSANSIA